jgi:putative ABC transport system substrate-binding protein
MAQPCFAAAQIPRRLPLIAVLGAVAPENLLPSLDMAFADSLRRHGWIAGDTVDLTRRLADGHMDRLPVIAAELVGLGPAVILASGPRSALAAKAATPTIPIVCPDLGDADRFGLMANDARPESNVTGLRNLVIGMLGKQIEVARDALPGLARIGVLHNPKAAGEPDQAREIKAGAEAMGLTVFVAQADVADAIPDAIAGLARAQVQAVIVLDDPVFLSERQQIAALAQPARIATLNSYEEQVAAGGLISYGPDMVASWRRAGDYVDRILRGAKPSDLPVEFPDKLRLAVNLRTAKALGLAIPPTFIARADQVIE